MESQPASALDLFVDSTRLLGDSTIVSVMEFDRHLDVERLNRAVAKCFEAFPILTSRMVRGNGPAYWEYMGNDGLAKASVEMIGDADYRPHVIRPMVPYSAPQACFRVLRSGKRDVVVIDLAHAAADGYGMKELTRTLLAAYIDPDSIEACTDILPARDTLWTEKLLDGAIAPKEEGIRLIDPMWPSPCGPSKAPSTYHRAIISKEGLEQIKRTAKAHRGTVNDVLMAAYFMAMSDLTGHYGPQNLFFPVNLRRYLKDGSRVMSNQSANVSLIVTREKGDGMSEVLDKIVFGTKGMKSRLIGIREQVEFDKGSDLEGKAVQRMVEEMDRKQKEGLADIFISNPGPMDLPDVDGLVGAYVCYPGVYMPSTCFIVTTFRGEMSIVVGYQDDVESKKATWTAVLNLIGHLDLDDELIRFQKRSRILS